MGLPCSEGERARSLMAQARGAEGDSVERRLHHRRGSCRAGGGGGGGVPRAYADLGGTGTPRIVALFYFSLSDEPPSNHSGTSGRIGST